MIVLLIMSIKFCVLIKSIDQHTYYFWFKLSKIINIRLLSNEIIMIFPFVDIHEMLKNTFMVKQEKNRKNTGK